MNVPVDDGNAIDLRIVLLRVTCRDGDVIEQTEAHRAFRRRMMARRPHRNERVMHFALHDQIDRLTRRAGRVPGRVQRTHGDDGVSVEITATLTDNFFYVLVELW